MVDADVITAKLAELVERTTRARLHCRSSAAELASDRDALDLVSFNLMLAVQSCLDIASHILADEGWEPATTLAGSFLALSNHGVISAETAESLGRAAGLRNIIAHGYASADAARIQRAAAGDTQDLERFSAEVSAWLSGTLGSQDANNTNS
ncbi:MAG: DUF86 domain-containing protein [Thermoanaerobaculia bacterium]